MRGESGVSDDLASEVLSHYSSASESASVIEEGTGTQTIKTSYMHKPYHKYTVYSMQKIHTLTVCAVQGRW